MSKELIKMENRFDKIVHFQGSLFSVSEYIKKEKWGIVSFLIVYIALFISQLLFIDWWSCYRRRTNLCISRILFRSISQI